MLKNTLALSSEPEVLKENQAIARQDGSPVSLLETKNSAKLEADVQMVRQACNGDISAWNNLEAKYRPKVFSLMMKLAHLNLEVAEDLTQTALLIVYKNLYQFKGESQLGTWIYTLAYNEARRYFRSGSTKKETLNDHLDDHYDRIVDSGDSPEEAIIKEQLRAKLKEIFDFLGETDGILMKLKIIEELPDQKIAQLLNITVQAVKSRACRARRKIKEILRDYC